MHNRSEKPLETSLKSILFQKLFWHFTVWINCSSDLKFLATSRPSASNFKRFSRLLKQFFLTVDQNNFGNKIPPFRVFAPFTSRWCRRIVVIVLLLENWGKSFVKPFFWPNLFSNQGSKYRFYCSELYYFSYLHRIKGQKADQWTFMLW